MQLSKLTFSLASLVLLMAFAFIAMSVMADDGTIGIDGTHDSDVAHPGNKQFGDSGTHSSDS